MRDWSPKPCRGLGSGNDRFTVAGRNAATNLPDLRLIAQVYMPKVPLKEPAAIGYQVYCRTGAAGSH